jgi:hypothetical protein
MGYHSGPHHIQIDINQALNQMNSAINCGGMIPIFPERPFASFSLVILLAGPAGYQLNRPWNDLLIFISHNQKVDVI